MRWIIFPIICLYAQAASANGTESFLSGFMQGIGEAQARKDARTAHEACLEQYAADTCMRIEAEMARDQQAKIQQEQQQQEMRQLRQEVEAARAEAAIARQKAQAAQYEANQ
jgi:hypothetical protein